MKLRKVDDRYVLDCSYDERMVAKGAGFWWDPALKQWYTKYQEKAALLSEYADPGLAAELKDVAATRQAAVEASKAVDADLNIPAPEGLSYLPFQRAGIAYAMARGATLMADEMGLGKTIEAIGVLNTDPAIQKVLVICPAGLKLNWYRELQRWLIRPARVGIVDAGSNGWLDTRMVDVVIINYDILDRHIQAIHDASWDLLIVDECHYLKNPKAKRTALVLGRWARNPEDRVDPIRARRRLYLTGTPIVNRPIELWPLVHSLDPEGLGRNWHGYVKRYCGMYESRWGMDVSGATNLEELQERLRATIMVRRLKADVLTELPAKRRQIVELECDGLETRSAVRAELEAWEKAKVNIEDLQAKVELAKADENEDAYRAAVERLNECMRVTFSAISRLRHETALAKLPQVIDNLEEALESGHKVVCFAHHHDVVDGIMAKFKNAVRVDGRMDTADRQASIDRFQKDPSCRLFVGSIMAAGVGITLTAAAHAVFAELDWVPGNITQAEDRLHRIGQRDSVLVQHLVLDGSLDARMAKTLVAKQEVIDRALDRTAEPIPPAVPVLQKEVAATESATRKKIAQEATTFTAEMIGLVHDRLRILAGMCDGARALDDLGFSKMDARLGHDLARAESLSPRQAALGARLVHKYRRQVGELPWLQKEAV